MVGETSSDQSSTPQVMVKVNANEKVKVEVLEVDRASATQAFMFDEIRPRNLEKGWSTLAKTLTENDEVKVRDCKEDMDTLLVFAGLFSAVLTAFNIESYQSLQPDSNATVTFFLMHISTQLQSFSLNSGFLNSTQSPMPQMPTFYPAPTSIRINVLWFSSLVISLVTASLAMLVKQWLREYMAQENVSPRSRIRVRYWRNEGLVQWRVFEIAALLPLLLQLSLLLFFAGLCVFLQDLNLVVGLVITVLVAIWSFLYLSSIMAPGFSSKCPYKTPLLKDVIRSLRLFFHKHSWYRHVDSIPDSLSIHDELAMRQDTSLDVPSLAAADANLQDDDFVFSTIRTCLADLGGRDIDRWVCDAIVHRTGRFCNSLMEIRFTDFRHLSQKCRLSIVHILIDAISREVERRLQAKRPVEWVSWMSGALRCIGSGLLPMFRASDDDRWLEVGQRAGKMLVGLFTQNRRIASSVLENLSYSTYPRLPSSYMIPEISSAEAWQNVLDGARTCMGSNTVEPAQLCQVVLYLALHVEPSILEDSSLSFRSLMLGFTSLLMAHISRKNPEISEWRYLAALSLEHIEKLSNDHPVIIDTELVEVFTLLASHPELPA